MSRKNPKKVFYAASLLALSCGLLAATSRAAGLESVYTDLEAKFCKNRNGEGDASEMSCPGVGGYRLQVLEGDLRSSITVVDPKGREHPLEYWSVVAGGFSTLGSKAEWRIERQGGKVVPKALIVRVNASENPDKPDLKTSYLAVARLNPGKVCVTDRIPPGPKANELAREAADNSAAKACLTFDAINR